MFVHGVSCMDTAQTNEKILESLLIAEDPQSKFILEMARKAAMSQASVLITGETGVGKELLARYIHQNSPMCHGPYVSVNCAALPDNMIESILFGYEKGAFTGAINTYQGKFEQANNGTLLLDEIAELPLGLQAKLLRVLQEFEIERLGGKRLIKVNARIIAATNRDLKQQVQAGLFRSDLYYRLNVVPLVCDALRNRSLDIIPLANYFVKKYASKLGKNIITLTDMAKNKLMQYSWPGNVRELENIIHRAIIMLSGNVIDEQHILIGDNQSNIEGQFHTRIKENEAKFIIDVLNEVDGSRDIAARILNISPRTLRYKISKLKAIGIKVP